MTGAAILPLGKALAWVGIPLALALWELWRLSRDRDGDADSSDWFVKRPGEKAADRSDS
jgi:hypothetical protein